MSVTDDLVAANARYADAYPGEAAMVPRRAVAVVACMDARVDVAPLLGLAPGDAHVLRNAGGVVTDDVIRSLAISQRRLDTREVVLVHHSDCGMSGFTDEEFLAELRQDTGQVPAWSPASFADVEEDVRRSIARVVGSPFLPYRDRVRGFVVDVGSGRLHEVRPG